MTDLKKSIALKQMWPQKAIEPLINIWLWYNLVHQTISQAWDPKCVLQALKTFQVDVTWLETTAYRFLFLVQGEHVQTLRSVCISPNPCV